MKPTLRIHLSRRGFLFRVRFHVSRPGLLLWGLLVLVVAGTALLIATRPPPEHPAPTPPQPVPVRVLEIVATRAADRVELPVHLDPWTDALVAAPRPGRVVELRAEKGDRVKRGDVLLRVDDRVWSAAAQRAAVALREAERDLARTEELRGTGAVSESDFDAVRARRDTAAAAATEAQTMLSQCTVTSPVDGVVNRRLVELGEHAPEGGAVYQVLQTDRLRLRLDVPEKDVYAVRNGEPLAFRVDALPGAAFTGTVHFVSAQADPASNAYAVEATVDNGDGRLRAGLIGRADLVRRVIEDAVVVPMDAVVPKKGEHIVFVVEGDGHAARRVVGLRAMLGDSAVLDRGLQPGDRVVVEGQRTLSDGAAVEVRDAAASPGGNDA